ncbi:MAG: response regulator transcription factor [Chloroflexota bacterium]|nr:response regulator transcription factor [Chloroflexota bacterium]
MPDTIKVLIVDDHVSFAESLAAVLGRRSGITVVAVAHDAASAVREAIRTEPDVTLMDQGLPDDTGAHAAAALIAARPGTAVVMLTGGGSQDDMLDAVEAGVCGYLIKTARVDEIAGAVEHAAAGEMLMPPAQLGELLRHARERVRVVADRARVVKSLTQRERDVLRCMATAMDTRAIAEKLGISRHTARGYVQTVMEKLAAHTRLEAVLRAQALDLLGPA